MSSIGVQFARAGLKDMYTPGVASVQDQCRIGLTYDRDIASQSPDAMEQLVGRTSLQAYNDVADVYSGEKVLKTALNAVSSGVGGPAGPTLSHIASDSMYGGGVASVQDQCRIGLDYTKAIRDNGTVAEATVARTILAAYDSVANVYSGEGQLKMGLNAVAGGVGGPMGGVLASLGVQGMHTNGMASVQDQCRVGLVFTKAVRDNTTDAGSRALAVAALQSYNRVSDVYSGQEILENFLKSAH